MHVILILLVMLANYTFAFAEISEPMTINIIENPVSLNGLERQLSDEAFSRGGTARCGTALPGDG